MVTRKNAEKTNGLASGYTGIPETDEYVASCNIEDVDKSLFKLFDKELSLQLETKKDGILEIPVIFATGERFAIVKRKKPIRDHNRALILPLISIARTGIQQTNNDIAGRGINQSTGDLIVKRKLTSKDRNYQNILNKLDIRNQNSTATKDSNSHASGSTRLRSENASAARTAPAHASSAYMHPNIGNNIHEFIAIPQPQFYTANYTITLYTQYTQHMNQLIQQIINSFLPQGRCFKLTTEKGYWFNAFFDDSFDSQSNVEDFANSERVIMTSINCTVPAYLIAGSDSGSPTPIRKYYSAPNINFNITTNHDEFNLSTNPTTSQEKKLIDEQFNGSRIKKIFSNDNVGETIYKKI